MSIGLDCWRDSKEHGTRQCCRWKTVFYIYASSDSRVPRVKGTHEIENSEKPNSRPCEGLQSKHGYLCAREKSDIRWHGARTRWSYQIGFRSVPLPTHGLHVSREPLIQRSRKQTKLSSYNHILLRSRIGLLTDLCFSGSLDTWSPCVGRGTDLNPI